MSEKHMGSRIDDFLKEEGIFEEAQAQAIKEVTGRRTKVESVRRARAPVQKQIRTMVSRIVRQFNPDRVILFGSHGRGDAGPGSDVDLLVVMPVKGSRRDKAVQIGVALHDIRVPKDIIVTTPEDFEWRKQIIGTIERPAVREGRVLYAR